MNLQKTVADNIKGFRKKLGYTQEQLAAKAELSSNHLARMERNEKGVAPSLQTLAKLAKALKIPPNVLLIADSYMEE
ncbi:MAG TPA: helix-turn-helix transcriptional regulator [Candidatus Kapabacteria bacterium]|nr:helix-turn-helix transcriptional regulator [Candidatus Kapabacteria bacterium]